ALSDGDCVLLLALRVLKVKFDLNAGFVESFLETFGCSVKRGVRRELANAHGELGGAFTVRVIARAGGERKRSSCSDAGECERTTAERGLSHVYLVLTMECDAAVAESELNRPLPRMVDPLGANPGNGGRFVIEPLPAGTRRSRYAACPNSPVATSTARAITASRMVNPITAGVASGSISMRSTFKACTTNQ